MGKDGTSFGMFSSFHLSCQIGVIDPYHTPQTTPPRFKSGRRHNGRKPTLKVDKYRPPPEKADCCTQRQCNSGWGEYAGEAAWGLRSVEGEEVGSIPATRLSIPKAKGLTPRNRRGHARISLKGKAPAFQAGYAGSIPVIRSSVHFYDAPFFPCRRP